MTKPFNPLEVVRDVKGDYKTFVLSSFPFSDEKAKDQFLQFIEEEELLWTGPYLSLARQYELGEKTVADFCGSVGISPEIATILPITRFFAHQEKGIQQIYSGKNTIVSTGTGSGKTEIFLVPILDHCLKTRTPGIKAILIYPMNALVNDQADRLRRLLFALNQQTAKQVTFGVYTGQTPHNDEKDVKERIALQQCPIPERLMAAYGCGDLCPRQNEQERNKTQFEPVLRNGKWVLACKANPQVVVDYQILTREEFAQRQPDILITNYVQLEFLLLRKNDGHLFARGQVHHLVFDEIHWYSGSTGCEVALLTRRLIERLRYEGGNIPICIGTSATISTKKEDQARQEIAEFARKFFGQPFETSNAVLGDVKEIAFNQSERYMPTPLRNTEIFEDIRSLDSYSLSDKEFEDICLQIAQEATMQEAWVGTADRRLVVGRILSRNALYQAIVHKIIQPKTQSELAEEIFLEDQFQDIRDLYLAACNGDPVQARRKLEEDAWAYLNLAGLASAPETATSSEFVPLVRPQVHMFYKASGEDYQKGEVYACLSCGTMYPSSRERCACGGPVEEIEVCRYCGQMYWRAMFECDVCDHSKDVKQTIGKAVFQAVKRVEQGGVILKQTTYQPVDARSGRQAKKCRSCGALNPVGANRCACDNGQDLMPVYVYNKVNPCPFCGNRYGPGMDTTTPIYQSPNIASRRIFSSLYNQLPDALRKMLIFSDSRQNTSFTAGTIPSEHLARSIRQLVCYLVRQEHKPLSYVEMEAQVLQELANWEENKTLQDWQPDLYKRMFLEEVSSLTSGQWSGEKVGLVAVGYKGLEEVDADLESTAQRLIPQGDLFSSVLAGEKWRRFLVAVLHMMRWEKAISGMETFREGRSFDKPTGYVFDPNYNKTESGSYEIKNPFSSDRTKLHLYTKQVFPKAKVDQVLQEAFKTLRERNLIHETEVGRYRGQKETAFVVDRKRILLGTPEELMRCNRCEWTFHQPPDGTCLRYNCRGSLEAVPDLAAYWQDARNVNFEYSTKPPRMNVEEDSGNLTLNRRTIIERKFKDGKIDLIVCTPTLELGIDIGDMVSVGMSQVPPSPASYAQRAGRAGRREKIALASTFLFHNPIDMYYFQHPKEIILGEISAPVINLENRTIIERHVRSVVVEDLFVKGANRDRYASQGGVTTVRLFIDNGLEGIVRQDVAARTKDIVDTACRAFAGIPVSRSDIEQWVKGFPDTLAQSMQVYQRECDVLMRIRSDLFAKSQELMYSTRHEDVQENKQIKRILDNIVNRFQDFPDGLSRRDVLSHLSRTGVLPRYSFPGVAVETMSDTLEDFGGRDARTAVTERVPGAPLYMNKQRYQVIGYDFDRRPEDKDGTVFWVCQDCHIYAKEFEKPLQCPECGGHKFDRFNNCISPRLVVVGNRKRPAGTDPREYLDTETDYFTLAPIGVEGQTTIKKTPIGEIRALGQREILTLTTGALGRDGDVECFHLCEQCGKHLTALTERNKHRMPGTGQWCHSTQHDRFNLYHRFMTNAILLQLNHGLLQTLKIKSTPVFLTTMKNALLGAAEIVFSAGEGEIDGVIKPDVETIIFFDNVDGGVGYVEQLAARFDTVLERASGRVLSPRDNCEKGCVKCLYSFRRRRDISRPGIDKRTIIPLFQYLVRSRLIGDIAVYSSVQPYTGQVVTIPSGPYDLRGSLELRNLMLTAQNSIKVVTLYVTDDKIDWDLNGGQERASWCDILCHCQANGVNVDIMIGREPTSEKHRAVLDRLEREGANIRIFRYARPDEYPASAHFKQVVIDGDNPLHMAAVETSANLSRETYTSANTFTFGEGVFNWNWIRGIMANIQAVEEQSIPWAEYKRM